MRKYPKTSVIIPSYNESDYLIRNLEALHNQTVPVAEIIVVDNNSTDDSIMSAKKLFPEVKFIFEKQQGIVFARNTGFNAAKGDIFIKLDADSVVMPSWHERLLLDYNNNSFDAWSGYVTSKETPRLLRPIGEALFNSLTFIGIRMVSGAKMVFGSNMALTKETWKKIEPELVMRNDIWEDLDVALQMHKIGAKVFTSKAKLVNISSRSVKTTPMRAYRRLYGQPRVYKLHNMPVAYIASFILMHISFVVWLLFMPIAYMGYSPSKRPREDQY